MKDTKEGFITGTKISTPNGKVNIEDIKLNDIVLSYNKEDVITEGKVAKVYSLKNRYTFTILPFHNYIANDIRVHNKSDDDGGTPRVPIEATDNLFSKATAEIADLLCEGEIEEITSSYFDEVPSTSFAGITEYKRLGITDQVWVPGIPVQGSEINVSTAVTHGSPVQKQITDTSVDDVRVTLHVPALMNTNAVTGDISAASVSLRIDVNGNIAKTTTIKGKTTSGYQRSVRIRNLSNISAGPWTITVHRITADSSTARIQNSTVWSSYTEIKNIKLKYNDSALVGYLIDAKQFGDRIPRRAYELLGMKTKVPSNYDAGTYPGEWDGTWKVEYNANPIWCYRDFLTDDRYGLAVPEDMIDNAGFYIEAQYCDQFIDDGEGGTHPRFSLDCVISNRAEANHLINLMASSCNAMPYWSAGKASIVIDRPRDPSRIVTNANVENGEFVYEGTDLSSRFTVCHVTWNDLGDFSRPAVEVVEDPELIERYGYRPVDITAFGCNNRARAQRFGKWFIYTSCYQTQKVTYIAGWDHADATPGEVIILMDDQFTTISRQGRTVAASSTQITIDRPVDLDPGETYVLYTINDDGTVEDNIILTTGDGISVLTINDTFDDIPENHTNWLITGTDVAARQFRVLNVKQAESGKYEVSAIQHDPNKFAIIEQDIEFEPEPYTNIPEGQLDPPTNLQLEEYTYLEGQNWLTGVLLSWEHSPDPRRVYYDVQYKTPETPYSLLDYATDPFYDHRPVTSGTYNFRVRATGVDSSSIWLTTTGYIIYDDPDSPAPVLNLRCEDSDSTTFDGQDCEITWDEPSSTTWSGVSINHYQVEVYNASTDNKFRNIHVPKDTPRHIYTYETNKNDHGGQASRTVKFKVYAVNYNDRLSEEATLIASNPIPDMSSTSPDLTSKPAYLKVDWDPVIDADMSHYDIFYGVENPPTTSGARIIHPDTSADIQGLEYGITYNIQIIPYDKFGVGTASQVDGGTTLLIPGINVDVELQSTITITDSDDNPLTTASGLYDGIWNTGGQSYTVSGTDKWIQYEYDLVNYINRVAVWTNNANGQFYVALSEDAVSWDYYKAEADHTTDIDLKLLAATNQADAQTNYWQMQGSGLNLGVLPGSALAKYVRLYMVGNWTTTIHELVPSRILISELAAIEHLSAISVDAGTIVAGTLQSADYNGSQGVLVDLDAGEITGEITFLTGTSGISNISDAGDLAVLDTVGITECDATIITGGKIATDLVVANSVGANEIITEEANIGTATINTLHLVDNSISNDVVYSNSSNLSINGWTYNVYYECFTLDYVTSSGLDQTEYTLNLNGSVAANINITADFAYYGYSTGLLYRWRVYNVDTTAYIYTFTDNIGLQWTFSYNGTEPFFFQEDSGGDFNVAISSGWTPGQTVRLICQAARIKPAAPPTTTTTGDITVRFGHITGLKK